MSATIHEQFYKVDLNQSILRVHVGDIATHDENANRFGAELYKDGTAVNAAGLQVKGYFIRPDYAEGANGEIVNYTVLLDGAVEGNRVYVDLNDACYEYDGAFTLTVKVTGNGLKNAVLMCDGNIAKTQTDVVINNNRVIYSVAELLEQIDAMETATTAANTAAGAANTAATNANNATVAATNAATAANTAAGAANDAAGLVNGYLNDLPVPDDTQASQNHPWSGAKTKQEIEKFACRDNLLDNAYFMGDGTNENFPINQRKKGSYETVGYTIDRWKADYYNTTSQTVSLTENGLRVQANSTGANSCVLSQKIIAKKIAGKQLTFSMVTNAVGGDEMGLHVYVYVNDAFFTMGSTTALGLYHLTFDAPDNAETLTVAIGKNAAYGGTGNTDFTLAAVKLELGSTQTLVHLKNGAWTFNKVPHYGEELARCQRFVPFCMTGDMDGNTLVAQGIGRGTNVVDFIIPLPVSPRTFPTISISKPTGCPIRSGSRYFDTTNYSPSFYVAGATDTHVYVRMNVSQGIIDGAPYQLLYGASGSIIISCDL